MPSSREYACNQCEARSIPCAATKDPSNATDKNIMNDFRKDVLREIRKLRLCWSTLDFKTPKGFLELKGCIPSIPPKAMGNNGEGAAWSGVESFPEGRGSGDSRMHHGGPPQKGEHGRSRIGPCSKACGVLSLSTHKHPHLTNNRDT
jgi:hypothetical protein